MQQAESRQFQLNRLTSLTPPVAFTSGSFGLGYDALSRRTSLTRPNGVNTGYSYDNLSRLISVLQQRGGATLDGATYTVDNAGNRTSKNDLLAGVTSNYAYDSIYQLLQVTQGAATTESYSYDLVGNRLSSVRASAYTYNASNELISTLGASYAYDPNGNTLSKTDADGTTTYAWDFENRLTSVSLPGSGGTVSFRYDPIGRRIQKVSSAGTSVFAYDGDNVIEELNSSGVAVARYTQGLGIDEPLAMLHGGATTYYEADGLDSVSSLTDSAGVLTGTYTYDSFGNLAGSMGSLTNPFRFTAREFDPETNLYSYRARYFDPTIGRFISEDPIRFRGGTNFYIYALNNPLTWVDPNGLDVTVARYTAINPRGHVGIGVNSDTTEGFYPNRDNYEALTGGPGNVHRDTKQLLDFVVIPTTLDQDAAVQRYIDGHRRGHYSLLNNNCARFIERALGAAGISSSDTKDPITLMQDLHRAYDPPEPVVPPNVQNILDNPWDIFH